VERRLVIVELVEVPDAPVVVTKRIPRRPRYRLGKERQPVAVKSQLVKRHDCAIRKNRNGADGDALKISFISKTQLLQQFGQHNDKTDARQIGAMIEVVENVLSIGVSEHHNGQDAQERPEESELDFSVGPPADANDQPGEKRGRN